jgi:uncharacterized protein involved in outer membrane biogenesis
MRIRTAIATAVGGVSLATLVVAAWAIVEVDRFRPRVQTALSDRLHRDVSLGRMQLRLIPLGLRFDHAVIAEDAAFRSDRPFARAGELTLQFRAMPLLVGRVELRSVELRQPSIELVRSADGAWNFITLAAGDDAGGRPPGLAIRRLSIVGGEVAVTDRVRDRSERLLATRRNGRVVYRNIDVTLEDYAPGRPFAFAASATLPGTGAGRLTVSGTGGPVDREHLATTAIDGVARLEQVSMSGLQRFLGVAALEDSEGVVSGSASLRSRGGELSSHGSFGIEQAQVRGLGLGYPIALDFDVAHDLATGTLTVRSSTIHLDHTPLSLDGTIDFAPEPPALDVHLATSDAPLAEAARLASAFGVAFGRGTTVQGRLTADLRARGRASRPSLDGRVRLRDVSIAGGGLPRPVRTNGMDLVLSAKEIWSNDFVASANGTSLRARFALGAYTTRPVLDLALNAADASAGELVNIGRAWGVRALDGISGTGQMTLDVRATGPADSLAFSGSGRLSNATISTTALGKPLRVQNARFTCSRDSIAVDQLEAGIGQTTARGRVTLRRLKTPQIDFQLSADALDVLELQAAFDGPARQRVEPGGQAPQGVLARTTGSGRLHVGTLRYDAMRFDEVQTTAAIDRGVIRLEPLTAKLFGGRHRGSIVVDARHAPMTFAVASNLDDVEANELASAVANTRDVIYGALGSAVRVKFAADGSRAIARSLDGTMSVNVPSGRIMTMDLVDEVAAIGRFLTRARPGLGFTRMTGLTGHFNVSNGILRTTDLAGTIEGGRIGTSGSVNLVNEVIDLRMVAVLSREFSQRVGGTRVGGLMATVLANDQGELVVPMLVTGTIHQPRFAPDLQRLAEMKMRKLVPGLSDPQRMTRSILRALEKSVSQPDEEQEPQDQAVQPESESKPDKQGVTQQLEEALRKLLEKQKPK